LIASKILKRGDVVLDIGANIGFYVLIEAGLTGEEGKVYAVEPVERNIKFLRANVALNGYKNVEIFKLAFGDHNGKITINIAEAGNLSSINTQPNVRYVGKEEVDLMTVDDFLADKHKPKLIRMDVEGSEYEILKGMQRTLKEVKPLHVVIELHRCLLGHKKTMEIIKIFKDNGFKVKFLASDQKILENVVITALKRKIYNYNWFRFYNVPYENLNEICKTVPVFHIVFSKG